MAEEYARKGPFIKEKRRGGKDAYKDGGLQHLQGESEAGPSNSGAAADQPPEQKQAEGVCHIGVWDTQGHHVSSMNTFSRRGSDGITKDDPHVTAQAACLDTIEEAQATQKYLKDTQFTQIKMNAVLCVIDPSAANVLFASVQYFKAHDALATSALANSVSCFISQAAIANRQTEVHFDGNSVPTGWDALVTFGAFQGGNLEIMNKKDNVRTTVPATTNLSVAYAPGTGMLLRGALFPHRVAPYFPLDAQPPAPPAPRKRFTMAFFCDKTVLKKAKLTIPFPEPRPDHAAWIKLQPPESLRVPIPPARTRKRTAKASRKASKGKRRKMDYDEDDYEEYFEGGDDDEYID